MSETQNTPTLDTADTAATMPPALTGGVVAITIPDGVTRVEIRRGELAALLALGEAYYKTFLPQDEQGKTILLGLKAAARGLMFYAQMHHKDGEPEPPRMPRGSDPITYLLQWLAGAAFDHLAARGEPLDLSTLLAVQAANRASEATHVEDATATGAAPVPQSGGAARGGTSTPDSGTGTPARARRRLDWSAIRSH